MKQKIFLVLCVLFAIIFINAGLDKFFHYMPRPNNLSKSMLKVMAALLEIGWLMPLVAIIEILGGLMFLSKKTHALGAVIIFPIMIGILLMNLFYAQEGLVIAGPLFLINLWVIYENREKYARMFW